VRRHLKTSFEIESEPSHGMARAGPGEKIGDLGTIRTQLQSFTLDPDREKKRADFLNLLDHFEDAILAETQKTVLKRAVSLIFDQILTLIPIVVSDFESFWKTCRILGNAQSLSSYIPPAELTTKLFLGYCKHSKTRPSILRTGSLFFHSLLIDNTFAISFLNSDLPCQLFELLSNCSQKEAFEWSLDMLFFEPNETAFFDINLTPLFIGFRNFVKNATVSPDLMDIVADRFATFFIRLSKITRNSLQQFSDVNGFELIHEICSVVNWQKVFLKLCQAAVHTIPSAYSLFKFLHHLYKRESDKQCLVFELLIMFKNYEVVNSIYAIKNFFKGYLRRDKSLFDFCVDLDKEVPQLVIQILPSLFKLIHYPFKNIDIYRQMLAVSKHQVYSRFASWEELFQSNFLEVFVLQPSKATRLALFQNEDWLSDFVIQVASLPEARTSQPPCLLAILEISDICGWASQFLKQLPFPHNIRALLAVPDHKTFSVLLSSFDRSEKTAIEFVDNNGLSALTIGLANGDISIDFYVDFISKLVSCRRFEEVDQFIMNLPSNHLIHHLSQS